MSDDPREVVGDWASEKFREKDAEIERLKAQVKELSEAYQKAIGPIQPADKSAEIEDKALITELVYWIESLWPSLSWGSDDSTMGRVRKLIQRARKATR